MGQAFRNSGYQKASDLFADIESGKVGSRTRGQVRTLRDIDRTESGLGGYNPYQTAPAFSVKNTAKRIIIRNLIPIMKLGMLQIQKDIRVIPKIP